MKSEIKRITVIVAVFFVLALNWFVFAIAADLSETAIEKIPAEKWPVFEDDEDLRLLADAVTASITYYERLPGEKAFLYGPDRYTARVLGAGLRRFRDFLDTGPEPAAIDEFIRENGSVYAHHESGRLVDILFTGYYEPGVSGSLTPSEQYPYPVYGRPDDLAVIQLSAFALQCGPKTLVGRYDGREVVPYFDRSEIDGGALKGRAAPIAWVSDPVSLFFLHVQGSGKVILEDGRRINLHYDTSNGLAYKSIGKYLIDGGKIAAPEMSMQKIAAYIRANPGETKEILHYNPRYIFFKTSEHGIRGCINVPLTSGRSVALDQGVSPPGALLFMESSKPVCNETGDIEKWIGFSRFGLNQDTGSAIRGAKRADLFWGSGDYAEIAAGHMKHPGRLYYITIRPGE